MLTRLDRGTGRPLCFSHVALWRHGGDRAAATANARPRFPKYVVTQSFTAPGRGGGWGVSIESARGEHADSLRARRREGRTAAWLRSPWWPAGGNRAGGLRRQMKRSCDREDEAAAARERRLISTPPLSLTFLDILCPSFLKKIF